MTTKTFAVSSLALATLALATPANALTFNWSFVIGPGSTGQLGETISGTISGLVEGINPLGDLTVVVDSTPTGELTGGGWTPNFGFFAVTGGVITDFDAIYSRNLGGGIQTLDFGTFSGNFLPALVDSDVVPFWRGASTTTFTPVSATTPEPGSVVALLGLGALSFAGRKLRK